MKNQIKILAILFALAILSCKNKIEEVQQNTNISVERQVDSLALKKQNLDLKTVYNSKFLDKDNALVNGHKIILSKKEFAELYKKNDSIATQLWECGSPFEWLDEKWMIETYGAINKEEGTFENFNGEITTIYNNYAQFTTNNHLVLFDEALATVNNFKIISHNIILDRNTTLKSFKKTFPNIEIEKVENQNECRARFNLGVNEDAAFLFYFKNGKLNYFTLWWLLC